MNEKKFLEFIDVDFTYPPVEEYDENGEVFVQESKPVFEHFTAELPEGFVSLVGPNASGKSTLMMLASGRLCPSSGMVKLFETDTREFFPVIRITKTEEGEKQEIAQPRKTEEEKNILASVIYQNMEFETSEKVEELLKQVFENGEFQGKTPSEFGSVKYKFVKSTFPNNQPRGGIIISFTIESTILPNAAPIMIPTAISITLPRIANVLNSFPYLFNLSIIYLPSFSFG